MQIILRNNLFLNITYFIVLWITVIYDWLWSFGLLLQFALKLKALDSVIINVRKLPVILTEKFMTIINIDWNLAPWSFAMILVLRNERGVSMR